MSTVAELAVRVEALEEGHEGLKKDIDAKLAQILTSQNAFRYAVEYRFTETNAKIDSGITEVNTRINRVVHDLRAFQRSQGEFNRGQLAFNEEQRVVNEELRAFKRDQLAFNEKQLAFNDEQRAVNTRLLATLDDIKEARTGGQSVHEGCE